jgi:hypothetical protein
MENQESTQSSQSLPQNRNGSNRLEINPIQLLVNAVYVAYQRGAYSMKEAGLIAQAVEYFTTETNQAKVPEVLSEENQSNVKKEDENVEKKEKIVFQSQ